MEQRTPTLCQSLAAALAVCLALAQPTASQEGQEASPAAALTAALVAACRQNEPAFARYLTAENAAAFRELPPAQRTAMMSRFVLLAEPGRPLLSDGPDGRTVMRCETSSATSEMRIGKARIRENLAFVPLEGGDARATECGMVREGGGWRILSLGLLLVNVPELAKQWARADLEAKEKEAIAMLQRLADAVRAYREAFGRLPERLEQLGPAPKEGVSPEAAQLVDAELAAGAKAGYQFRYRPDGVADANSEPRFELAAAPTEYGRTGRRSFFLDRSGRLRGADKQGAVATAADSILETTKKD